MTCFNLLKTMSVGLIALWLAGCGETPAPEEILRPVRYQTVYATGGERARTFSGVSQAGVESRLSFKVAGTVQQVRVKVGDVVQPGDLIAELDPTDYELQVQQAAASLESARAQERNARANYERIRQLYENNNASRTDLDQARTAEESATAQVKALTKQLELARSRLGYCRLTAPVRGAIAAVDVEVNENVQTGQAVVQLSSGERLEVEVAIPGTLISQLREGQTGTVTFDALPDGAFEAVITEVGVTATGVGTTFPVTVRLTSVESELRPGMAAEVTFRFTSDRPRECFMVPPVAVAEDRQGRHVYVVTPSDSAGVGIVRRKAVAIGELTDAGLEVLEGLVDGDRVVTAGVSKIHDGQRVKLPETRP